MSTVRELHREAMKLAQQSIVARSKDDLESAQSLARRALQLEIQAVERIPEERTSEPTLSILYRSAASLAYQCGELHEAQRLVAKGLSGYPPPEILKELMNLFEQIHFEIFLHSQDLAIGDEELQIAMQGSAVGPGTVLYSEFISRIEKTKTLLDRTVQRLMGRKYQRAGPVSRKYRPFTPILAAPREGSFLITIKISTLEDEQIPLFPQASDVINEIIKGIELINQSEEESLKDLIREEGYYRNFLSLTRDIAPDGERISYVSFSSTNRSVSLTRHRRQIEIVPHEEKKREAELYPISVEGVLDYATSRKVEIVGLTTDEGAEYNVVIEEGLDDLVRSYYGRLVKVSGMLDRKKMEIIPRDILSVTD